MSENWESKDPIDLRTKIALKVLFLIFKVLSPYKFAHEFKSEIEAIKAELDKL